MNKIDKYIETILKSQLTDEEKISYMKPLHQIKDYSKDQLSDLEEKTYRLDGIQLSDLDKIEFEAYHLYRYFKLNDLDLSDIRRLYFKLKNCGNNEDEIKKLKRMITALQLDNNLNIRFYNSYLELLDEMEKLNIRQTYRTFSK